MRSTPKSAGLDPDPYFMGLARETNNRAYTMPSSGKSLLFCLLLLTLCEFMKENCLLVPHGSNCSLSHTL